MKSTYECKNIRKDPKTLSLSFIYVHRPGSRIRDRFDLHHSKMSSRINFFNKSTIRFE